MGGARDKSEEAKPAVDIPIDNGLSLESLVLDFPV
jgi:hypothetical protein